MRFLALVVVLAFVLSNQVHAEMNVSAPACQGNNDLLNTLTNLPNCIAESFFAYLVSGLISTVQGFIDSSFTFIFSSPNPIWFCGSYNSVMSVLESLFSIALMGIALMFILRSNDVEGRIESKKWLEHLLIMIIFLSFSFLLFQMMLDLNTYVSTSLANEAMKNAFSPSGTFTSIIFALFMLLFIVVMLVLTFVTLLIRYILIPFLLLLFPFAIFLYFIPWTKSWGKAFLKAIALIVFMTTIDALLLLGLYSLFSVNDPNLGDPLVKAFAVFFGFGALGIVNIFLFLRAGASVVSQSKVASAAIGLIIAKQVFKR